MIRNGQNDNQQSTTGNMVKNILVFLNGKTEVKTKRSQTVKNGQQWIKKDQQHPIRTKGKKKE